MSWVVTASVFTLILAPTAEGLVNTFLINAGVLDSGIYFLGDSKWWRLAYYIINIWKETGWQTVIFMATLAAGLVCVLLLPIIEALRSRSKEEP